MESPQPGAGHRMLEKFVGDRTGNEMLHPSPRDPQGGATSGEVGSGRNLDGTGGAGEYRGGFEGDVLTLSNPDAMGFSRAIFNSNAPAKSSFKMEYSQDGRQSAPFMEGSYTKT